MAMPKFSSPKLLILVSAGVLIAGAGVWRFALRPDETPVSTLPEELSVNALKAKISEPGRLRETMRETMQREDLTDEQRRELRRNMGEVFNAALNARVDEYLDSPPEKQNAILDSHLDEMQQRMAEFEKRRRDGEQRRQDERPSDRGQGFRQRSQQERKSASESRSPDETGRRSVYFTALQKRAGERGISMPGGMRGMGPRGGGRP